MTPSQKLMVQDGLPAVLLLTSESRAAAWAARPPRAMPLFQAIPRSEDAPTAAFRARVEAERRQKSLNQIARMKNRFALKAVDHAHMRWDQRRNKFVEDVPRTSTSPGVRNVSGRPPIVGLSASRSAPGLVNGPIVTKHNARALAEAAGVWKAEYEKLTGGLLVMSIRNRLRKLK